MSFVQVSTGISTALAISQLAMTQAGSNIASTFRTSGPAAEAASAARCAIPRPSGRRQRDRWHDDGDARHLAGRNPMTAGVQARSRERSTGRAAAMSAPQITSTAASR